MGSRWLLWIAVIGWLSVMMPAAPADALPEGVEAEEFATGLNFPVSAAALPDGRVLVTEKFGNVLLLQKDGTVQQEPVASFEVARKNEAGLLGLELSPGFADTGEFLVTYTPSDDLEHIYLSRIRLNEDGSGEVVEDPWLELPSRPDTDRHYGGNMRYGPDGHLFVALSELDKWELSQDRSELNGSILRYNPDLSIPSDNPFGPDSPIYSYGLRNTFDFDIASDGTIYGAENGHYLHDAIERLEAGTNHGWPLVFGYCDHYPMQESCATMNDYVEPVYEFRNQTGPSGMIIYEGELIPEAQGDILMGGWHSGAVHHLTEEAGQRRLEENALFFVLPDGPYAEFEGDEREHISAYGITDVEETADGAILVVQGELERGKVFRIAPAGELLDPARKVQEGEPRTYTDWEGTYCSTGVAEGPVGFAGMIAVFVIVVLVLLRRQQRSSAVAAAVLVGLVLAAIGLDSRRASAFDFKAGGEVGVGLSRQLGENTNTGTVRLTPMIGGVARLEALPWLAGQFEAYYAIRGAANRTTGEPLSLHYIMMPLTAHFTYPTGGVEPRIFAGGHLGVLLDARVAGESFTELLRRTEWGFTGGLGVNIPVPIGEVTVDASYVQGLTEVYNEPVAPDYLNVPKVINVGGMLSVGLLF